MAAFLVLLAGGHCPAQTHEQVSGRSRAQTLRGAFGTYNAAPRLSNGRVDCPRLVRELTRVHAQTYNWLVWHADSDWEDLQTFLPLAAAESLKIWVTLVPPSESPPKTKRYSEPFRLDYERWGTEIARLSLRYTNLVAWSLDDFSHNQAVLGPDRLKGILRDAREINPNLAFIPCCYYRHVTEDYAAKYRDLFDGVLFPFRNESKQMNLENHESLQSEASRLKTLFGANVPIFVDVYATKHSRLNDSTPAYVEAVMKSARECAHGVLIYCHQYEESSPEKHKVIKTLFQQWQGETAAR